jgi:hypothetical protein
VAKFSQSFFVSRERVIGKVGVGIYLIGYRKSIILIKAIYQYPLLSLLAIIGIGRLEFIRI